MPQSLDQLSRRELEQIMGGTTCTCYYDCPIIKNDMCSGTYSQYGACGGSEGTKCASYRNGF